MTLELSFLIILFKQFLLLDIKKVIWINLNFLFFSRFLDPMTCWRILKMQSAPGSRAFMKDIPYCEVRRILFGLLKNNETNFRQFYFSPLIICTCILYMLFIKIKDIFDVFCQFKVRMKVSQQILYKTETRANSPDLCDFPVFWSIWNTIKSSITSKTNLKMWS